MPSCVSCVSKPEESSSLSSIPSVAATSQTLPTSLVLVSARHDLRPSIPRQPSHPSPLDHTLPRFLRTPNRSGQRANGGANGLRGRRGQGALMRRRFLGGDPAQRSGSFMRSLVIDGGAHHLVVVLLALVAGDAVDLVERHSSSAEGRDRAETKRNSVRY